MEIREYAILENTDSAKLQEQVNKAIKNGWQPLGGVAVSSIGAALVRLYQAVVR
jgi:hypothetical protein